MTKADLADAIYKRHGALSRREALALVEQILLGIRKGLVAGKPVKITGFGSFAVVRRRPRSGRNPRTGAVVMIPGRVSPVFRPSRQVLLQLNPEGKRGPKGGTRDGH